MLTIWYRKKYAFEDILERPGIRAYNAFLVKDFVVFSTAYDGVCELHLVQADMNKATLINSWETHGDVTAVAGFSTPGRQFVAAALAVSGAAWLTVYPVNSKQSIVDLALDDRLSKLFAGTALKPWISQTRSLSLTLL